MLDTDYDSKQKIVHDVKNQLSAMLGITELLLSKLPLGSDLRRYPERLVDIIKKTNTLLQDYGNKH